MNSIAHIEINVSGLEKSKTFYTQVLLFLGWEQFDLSDKNVTGYKAPDKTHLFLVQTEKDHIGIFHRKNTGINHIALRVESMEIVEKFCVFLKTNNIPRLYHEKPKDYSSEYATEHYYAIFFEDPDRIKLEVAFIK